MNDRQIRAGRAMEARMRTEGRFASSTMDAEAMAPKTWILWKNSKRGEEESTLECEIYQVPRATDSTEAVGMLIGMCPKCGEHFTVREDNKSMTLGWIEYSRSRSIPHLKINWEYHCRHVLGREPRDRDKIAVVSSPERWLCDYCKGWCVKVTDSIAITDMTGATQIYSHRRASTPAANDSTETGKAGNGKILL